MSNCTETIPFSFRKKGAQVFWGLFSSHPKPHPNLLLPYKKNVQKQIFWWDRIFRGSIPSPGFKVYSLSQDVPRSLGKHENLQQKILTCEPRTTSTVNAVIQTLGHRAEMFELRFWEVVFPCHFRGLGVGRSSKMLQE